MDFYIRSNYNSPNKNDLLRLTVFCLFSILIHATIINAINLPIMGSVDKTFKPTPVKINLIKTLAIPEKIITPAPVEVNTSKAKRASSFTTLKKDIQPAQQKPPVKQLTPQVSAKSPKPIIIEKPAQTLNSIPLRNESLNFISEMVLEENKTDKNFAVFDPMLQQKINQARHEKTLLQEQYPDKLDLNIDDKNAEYDGYRETIVDGNCWLIPTDTSFDALDFRIVVMNPNCNKPENKLSNLIKSLKQSRKSVIP